eukprot:gnl/Dysnectes_brevis/3079_a3825_724.p1 GENE.gnl/Dysnectes_brevis/3079_a3825_724~~gnl/Dysnectes_brevis/3079_a3825_724.p1  ORF type:complete len:820 (-),score=325.40 gnl/Dysnectes_brevis/3079_a3825_724:37-2496(-)
MVSFLVCLALVVSMVLSSSIGNNELLRAFNAALSEIWMDGTWSQLYYHYFGLTDTIDADVFKKYLISFYTGQDEQLHRLDPPHKLDYPQGTILFKDCDLHSGCFDYPDTISAEGSLWRVLKEKRVTVLFGGDVPGLHVTKDGQHTGFEHDIVDQVYNRIGTYYLHDKAAIHVVWKLYTEKTKWTVDYPSGSKDFKEKEGPPPYSDLTDRMRNNREDDMLASGITSLPTLRGQMNFACATLVGEVGLLVRRSALQALFDSEGMPGMTFDDLWEDFLSPTLTITNFRKRIMPYFHMATRLPFCYQKGGASESAFQTQLDQRSPYNIRSPYYTLDGYQGASGKEKSGALWDAFVDGQCVGICIDSPPMLAMYRTLSPEQKQDMLYAFPLRGYESEGFIEPFISTENGYVLSQDDFVRYGPAFLRDVVDWQTGNIELRDTISVALEDFAQLEWSPGNTFYSFMWNQSFGAPVSSFPPSVTWSDEGTAAARYLCPDDIQSGGTLDQILSSRVLRVGATYQIGFHDINHNAFDDLFLAGISGQLKSQYGGRIDVQMMYDSYTQMERINALSGSGIKPEFLTEEAPDFDMILSNTGTSFNRSLMASYGRNYAGSAMGVGILTTNDCINEYGDWTVATFADATAADCWGTKEMTFCALADGLSEIFYTQAMLPVQKQYDDMGKGRQWKLKTDASDSVLLNMLLRETCDFLLEDTLSLNAQIQNLNEDNVTVGLELSGPYSLAPLFRKDWGEINNVYTQEVDPREHDSAPTILCIASYILVALLFVLWIFILPMRRQLTLSTHVDEGRPLLDEERSYSNDSISDSYSD